MSLKKLRKEMKKSLQDDYIFLDGEDGSINDVEIFVSTGCTALDYIITNRRDGGIPVGKITEITGLPHSGKSLMAITICASTQKMGGLAIYLDPENAFNDDFAKRVGLEVDADSFWLVQPPPPTVEALFKFLFDLGHQIDAMKKDGNWPFKFVTVIWDSVAATPCEADLTAENPDPTANVGLKPRILSKNLTTFLGTICKKDIALVCLNQLRTNIRAQPFTDPWIAPGGNAIPFYSSVRLRISPAGKLKEKVGNEEEVIGVKTSVSVQKTRFGPPFRKAEFRIYFTHGIDDPESIIEMIEKRKGVHVGSAGPKGKIIWFDGETKENAIKKSEFKKLFLSDKSFKNKVLDAFEKCMVRDMTNPMFKDDSEIIEDSNNE